MRLPQPISCERWHLDYQPKLADQHVDCVLTLGHHVEVSSDAWSFAVHDRDTVVQQFREPADQVGQSASRRCCGTSTPANTGGLDPATAQQKLCSRAWVASIYR